MIPDFTTDRLTVRHWGPDVDDRGAREALARDLTGVLRPEVLAHLPPSFAFDPALASQWIEARAAESEVYVLRLGGGRLVGLLIAGSVPPGRCHLGYLLGKDYWGQGLASEMLAGLIGALRAGALLCLIAGVDPGNRASVRVLEKAGFTPEAQGMEPEGRMASYRLDIGGHRLD